MDSMRKKRLISLLIVTIACLVLFVAENLFVEPEEASSKVSPQVSAQVSPPVSEQLALQTIAPEPEPVIQNINFFKFPEDFPSPFALLDDSTKGTTESSKFPASPPMIEQIPNNIPSISANFELPDMPVGIDNIAAPVNNIFLKAILYRPGQSNMAILDDGTNEIIVIEGDSSLWGDVSKITSTTVTLGSRTLSLEI